MFRLFECCALSFFERFVLSFSLKIERFVSDSAEIWICGLYKINGISETKQKTRIGRKRLSNADKILNGRKVSELPTLDELKFKGGCV